MLRAERQSAPMSKITNDGLTRSGTRCLIATVGVKGLKSILFELCSGYPAMYTDVDVVCVCV